MKVISYIFLLNIIFGFSFSQADTIVKTDFETIRKGGLSSPDIDGGQRLIEIYSEQEWASFWSKHFKNPISTPKAPYINFEEYIVLVALDDTRGGGGYSIEIKGISIDTAVENRPYTVILELQQPGSAAVTTAAINRPYHMIKFKK